MIPELVGSFDRSLAFIGELVADLPDEEMVLQPPGVGASWVLRGDTLAAGARTKPRALVFTFEGGVPEFPEGYLAPGFRVYGRAR